MRAPTKLDIHALEVKNTTDTQKSDSYIDLLLKMDIDQRQIKNKKKFSHKLHLSNIHLPILQ